jgi:hypothetical protein
VERRQVLDRRGRHHGVGGRHRGLADLVVGPVAEGVEPGIELVDPVEVGVDHLDRAQLPAADGGGELDGGGEGVEVGHGVPLWSGVVHQGRRWSRRSYRTNVAPGRLPGSPVAWPGAIPRVDPRRRGARVSGFVDQSHLSGPVVRDRGAA